MKVSKISFIPTKQTTIQNTQTSLIKSNFDKISFSAKTPEQILYTKEAKDLSKEAYNSFARSKNIKKQAQIHIDHSKQILNRAKGIQKISQEKYKEIEEAFKYAKNNKTVALADPTKNTQIIFKPNEIEEYKNDHLTKKVQKTKNEIILLEYPNTKKIKRSIFDLNTGELIEFSENFKTPTSKSSTSDIRFTFKNSKLDSCDFNVSQNPKNTTSQKRYTFVNEKLNSFSLNLHQTKNYSTSSEQEFLFDNDELIFHSKNNQTNNANKKTAQEVYIFSSNETQYISNFTQYPENIMTSDKVFCYEDSKLTKAIIGLYDDSSSRISEKYFTYNQNEKPQYCYLNHSTLNEGDFNFSDDSENKYDRLIYLG